MGGCGFGATDHTRGWPAVILRNAPLGNESPIHRQCDHAATPKKGNGVLAGEADPDPDQA